jgi:histone-lysine N-methyltransferase SUV39H
MLKAARDDATSPESDDATGPGGGAVNRGGAVLPKKTQAQLRKRLRAWFRKRPRLGGGNGAAAARCGAACSNRHGAPVGALYECHALCACRGNCGLRATQRGGSLGSAALAVRLTEHCGWGLFAAAAIGADEFVVEYTGEIVTKAAAEAREAGYQAAGLASYIFNLASVMSCQLGSASAVVIDSTHAGNVASFANHACKGANLVAKRVFVNHRDRAFPRVCFFTARAVAAGEELTLNYGDAPAPCHCGSCSGGGAPGAELG